MTSNTTYDDIWTTFLNNCKASDIDLPSTPERIYEQIKNAVMLFNNRLREDVKCDHDLETVDRLLSDDHLLILAHFIRLVFLKNQKTFFQTQFQPFQKDVGLKNFASQLRSLESSVEEQEKTIDRIIMNAMEDYL